MSRPPGFDVMDIDTSIANDPKFRRIQRANATHLAPSFMAYVALLGESWKAAERATIEDAWPVVLPFDEAIVESMQAAGLIDQTGRIPVRAWRKRFTEANQRRLKARDRYRRYNAKRSQPSTNSDADTPSQPRGRNVGTATTEPFRSEPIRTVPNRADADARATNGKGETDPYDEVVAWLAGRKAWIADGSKTQIELARMVDSKGPEVVIAAMADVPGAERAEQFVYGALHALYPLAGSRTTAAEEPDPEYVRQQLAKRRQGARSGNA